MMSDGARKRLNKAGSWYQDEFPPTYIVLQFVSNIHIEAVQWIICKIHSERKDGGAELLVRKQPDMPGEVSLENVLFSPLVTTVSYYICYPLMGISTLI